MELEARGQYCRRSGTEKLLKMGLTFLFKDKTRPLSADIRSQLLSLDGNVLVRGTLACHQNDLWGSLREGKQKSNSSTFFSLSQLPRNRKCSPQCLEFRRVGASEPWAAVLNLQLEKSAPSGDVLAIDVEKKTVLICTVLGERVLHHLEKSTLIVRGGTAWDLRWPETN